MSSSRNLSCLAAAFLCSVGGSVLAVEESRAQEARAAYAYVTNNLNQRAGPNTRFPALLLVDTAGVESAARVETVSTDAPPVGLLEARMMTGSRFLTTWRFPVSVTSTV